MTKSPWGNIGDWAADAERAEQEERDEAAKRAAEAAVRASSAAPPAGGGGSNFPSLKDSVSTAKQSKKKTKMSLHEFTTMSNSSSRPTSQRLTTEEMLRLPTGPKERAPGEEMPYGSRLGGGFSNYGSRSGGPGRTRDGDGGGGDGSWGGGGQRRSYGGGFEDDRRRGPPMSSRGGPEFDETSSRADEVDNWATMKKSLPSFNSGDGTRPSRYASLGGGSGGASRADEVDNWATTKKPIPPPAARTSSFGSGFRDSRPRETERWNLDGNKEKRRLELDLPEGGEGVVVKANKPNPFGAARPREDVLAEKGLDWKKLDTGIDDEKVVSSRPGSSQSSRPGSSQSARSESQQALPGGEGAVKSRPKVNPFGDAKPREVLLQEKGLDWRKIDLDLEHRRVERSTTSRERW